MSLERSRQERRKLYIEGMHCVVITGGVAMGKSTVVQRLLELEPGASLFDADASVRKLLTEEDIRTKIAAEFGRSALSEDGSVNRPFLRNQVFDSVQRRAALEGILHPEVRKRFENQRGASAAEGCDVFLADIPLFFESDSRYPADSVLVVAADAEVQMDRLLQREGIDRRVAERMVASQLPISEKVAGGDVVIWNNGSLRQLETQIEYFDRWLKTKI